MNLIRRINLFLNTFGFFPKKTFYSLWGLPQYFKNLVKFKNQQKKHSPELKIKRFLPQPDDRFQKSGNIEQHYFYQDLYVARKILQANPKKHVDIGSRIDGFVAIVASFRQIEIIDIRENDIKDPNIKFIKQDLNDASFRLKDYCDSLSCLHTLEHFGLGRYGDPIDVNGHIKGIEKFHSMLKNNGTLYLSVPIGPLRIEFDAHRVFSLNYITELINNKFQIKSFSYIDDQNHLHAEVSLNDDAKESNFGCSYGCGILELIKI